MNRNVHPPMPVLARLETFIKVMTFFEETHNHQDAQRPALETFKRVRPQGLWTKKYDDYPAIATQIQAEKVQRFSPEQSAILKDLAEFPGLSWPPPKNFRSAGAVSKLRKHHLGPITCEGIEEAITFHVQDKFDHCLHTSRILSEKVSALALQIS